MPRDYAKQLKTLKTLNMLYPANKDFPVKISVKKEKERKDKSFQARDETVSLTAAEIRWIKCVWLFME